MAGGFAVGLQFGAVQTSGPVVSTSAGTAITAGATANTVGSYTTLISSTTNDCAWLEIGIYCPHSSLIVVLAVNIAVGPAGSEVVIVPDLVATAVGSGTGVVDIKTYYFPCSIPAGSRISANSQSTAGSVGVAVMAQTYDDAFGSHGAGGVIDVYGFNPSTTLGTSVDPGGTANTKGAFAQLTAATNQDMAGFFLGLHGSPSATGGSSLIYPSLIDIAIGASGSEKIIRPNYPINMTASGTACNNPLPGSSPFYPIPIPAGTRIAARAQSFDTATPARQINTVLYGVRR
jgi:hypothetical protein